MTPRKASEEKATKKSAPRDSLKQEEREEIARIRQTPIGVYRSRMAQAMKDYVPPETLTGFDLDSFVYSATIQGDEIHATVVFRGTVETPDAIAKSAEYSQQVIIRAKVVKR